MTSQSVHRYFTALLVVFILSYMVQASAKWTNNLYYAFLALPGLATLVWYRGAGLARQPLVWGWLVFLAWCLVPAAYAPDLQFYKHILYTGLFVAIVASLTWREFFYRASVARAYVWIILLYIYLCATYAYLAKGVPLGARVDLLPGRMENVIYTSIWLVCALGVALPAWRREHRYVEMAVACVLSVIAVAFVLQTRTGLVGGAFLAGAWSLYNIYRNPRKNSVIVAGLVAGLAFLLWALWGEAWLASLISRGDSYRGDLFRIMTGEWQRCGWLMGCGVEFHTAQTLPGGIMIPHPHSIFVSLGVYLGGVSLVLFLALMAATLWHAWRQRNPWGMYLAAALLMLNFDGAKIVGNPDPLWLLVLLPAGVILGGGMSAAQPRKVTTPLPAPH